MTHQTAESPWSKRIRHYGEWLLLRSLMAFVRRGDMASAYARIHTLSWPLRQILRSEWQWTLFNVQLVYGPALPAVQRQRLACMALENIICSHVDSMRIDDFWVDATAVKAEISILDDTYRQGRGVILCAIHLGAWEAGIKILSALGYPLGVVYRHANNPLSEQAFVAVRAKYGVQWMRRDDPRSVLRILQEKKILLLMTDINQRQGGIPAPFLGVPAMCPVGAARLAMRFRCPVVPGVCLREGPGRVRFLFAPAIEPLSVTDTPEARIEMTTRINQSFNCWVHRYAEQYNWLHARWRSRPDGTLWSIKAPGEAEALLAKLQAARTDPYPILSERVLQLLA